MRKAELKAVLSLDNLQFARTLKKSADLAKNLAKSFARNPIQSSFVAGMMGARKLIQGTATGIEKFASGIKTGASVAVVAGTAIAGAFALVAKSAVDAAAEYETFNTSFEVLLGSAEKAKTRMAELAKFADTTPFDLDEVARASTQLQVMTKGALAGAKGLRMVGDVASGTNTNINEVAENIGRLYDAIRSGQPMGREMLHLTEIGAIGGESRNAIESLVAVGRTAEAWRMVQREFMRYQGMTEKQAKTWSGMVSTFTDSLRAGLRAAGAPLIEGLKPTLALLTKETNELAPKAEEFGKKFADGIKTGTDFIVGAFQDPGSLITPFVATLKAGFLEAGNVLIASMRAAVEIMAGPGFFGAMKKGFEGLANVVGGQFMKAFQKPTAYIQAAIDFAKADTEVMLTGKSSEQKNAIAERARLSDVAASAIEHAVTFQNRGDQGGADKQIAIAKSMMEKSDALRDAAEGKNTSIADRAARLMGGGQLGGMADTAISRGEKQITEATDALFKNISGALKKFKVRDVLGAAGALRAGVSAAAGVAAAGGVKIAAMTSPAREAFSGTVGVHASNFSVGDLHSSRRTTSLLSLQERRGLENDTAAQAMAMGVRVRRGSSLSARGVRRGDRARMQEEQRKKLRESEGLEKTNKILGEIRAMFDKMQTALVTE